MVCWEKRRRGEEEWELGEGERRAGGIWEAQVGAERVRRVVSAG